MISDFLFERFWIVILFVAALFCGLIYVAYLGAVAEQERCIAAGGQILSKAAFGVGVGVGTGGSVAVVPTTSTVKFCVTPDGRILW